MQRVISFTVICVLVAAAGGWAGLANRNIESGAVQQPQPINVSGFGSPLPAITRSSSDLQNFANGQMNFKEVESLPQVGPIFNGPSCAGCHSQPAIGGGGLFINELRVRNDTAPGPVHIFAVDNMLRSGPQTQGGIAIFPEGVRAEPIGCQITSPGCKPSACQREKMARTTFDTSLPTCDPGSADFARGGNCAVGRAATPLFGLGLVEAVSDNTLITLAQNEPADVRGTAKRIAEFGSSRIGRFGWKSDHATLRGFAGDAYLNEMGITNPDNPRELSTCALNQSAFGVILQTSAGIEDNAGPDGHADVDRFSDFMRGLNPPPQLAQGTSAQNGARLFAQSGCGGCHAPSLTTDANPASFIPSSTDGTPITSTVNSALASQTFHPYSDFLLHDMGSLGDGITSGSARPTMMRTAPLWGLRARSVYLHDGRAGDILSAIELHDGQGKAAAAAFKALTSQEQQDLINFLNTI